MLCKCEQATLSVRVLDLLACVCPRYSCFVYVSKRVFMYFMPCVLCVHVQLIKELLSDGSYPMTSKPQESFTYPDLWLSFAAPSEKEQDDIENKDRQDMVFKCPSSPTLISPNITYK